MRRVATPLMAMGATIAFEGPPGHDGLPMRVSGQPLTSIRYLNTHASAQVKGALLLAGLAAGVEVTVEEPVRSRDHSERMLLARGVAVTVSDDGVTVPAGQVLQVVGLVPGFAPLPLQVSHSSIAGMRMRVSVPRAASSREISRL